MKNKLTRAERIFSEVKDVRENDGQFSSRILAEMYGISQRMVLKDMQIASKYGLVKHDRSKKAYVYTGGNQQ